MTGLLRRRLVLPGTARLVRDSPCGRQFQASNGDLERDAHSLRERGGRPSNEGATPVHHPL